MSKKLFANVTAVTLATTLSLSATSTPAAQAQPSSSSTGTVNELAKSDTFVDGEQSAAEFEELLRVIDSVPDEVLEQGDQATQEWIQSRLTSSRASAAGCSWAITKFIGSNLINVSKILKVKKLIKEVGGVAKVVDEIRKAGWSIDSIRKIGGPLWRLVKEFLDIKEIEDSCFDNA